MKIDKISAQEILASGGYPTIEVEVVLEDGSAGRASVPYGASAGTHEAVVLVDEEENRYHGKGMLKAVANVENIIAPALVGTNGLDQEIVDETMINLDGTPQKSNLGGNAILAVSLSVARAAAASRGQQLFEYIAATYQTNPDYLSLPQPMMVVIEGGKHAHNTTDLQEYCMSAVGNGSPTENIRRLLESYHILKQILQEHKLSTNVGNEGAFAPNGISSNTAPLEYITEAIKRSGYTPGSDIGISIDAAASEFYENGIYTLKLENKKFTSAELMQYYEDWLKKYPIITMEDMLSEDDWDSWVEFNQIARSFAVPHIGDDLTVTDRSRLQKAIDLNAITGILIKLNQIGTLSETVATCMLSKRHGLMTVTSHRGGGETNDTAMVDLAVAVNSAYIKVGPTRGERVSKYNRLMEIERQLVRG